MSIFDQIICDRSIVRGYQDPVEENLRAVKLPFVNYNPDFLSDAVFWDNLANNEVSYNFEEVNYLPPADFLNVKLDRILDPNQKYEEQEIYPDHGRGLPKEYEIKPATEEQGDLVRSLAWNIGLAIGSVAEQKAGCAPSELNMNEICHGLYRSAVVSLDENDEGLENPESLQALHDNNLYRLRGYTTEAAVYSDEILSQNGVVLTG
jgi:hypothetical protein